MSLEKFITKLLNVKDSDLQELISLKKSDGSIDFKLKLKARITVCPFCGTPVTVSYTHLTGCVLHLKRHNSL